MIKDNTCTFIEITIPYEKDEYTLARREAEKEAKYADMTYNNLQTQTSRRCHTNSGHRTRSWSGWNDQ